MSFETWNYTGPFLEPFCQNGRNLIAQMFCNAYRTGGCRSVKEMVGWVADDTVRRRDNLRRRGGEQGYQESTLRTLWEVIDGEEVCDYAAFILWRESLPMDQRDKLKREMGTDFAYAKMETKEPSEKQLKYLRGLRCPITPQTMAEASRLIEEYRR